MCDRCRTGFCAMVPLHPLKCLRRATTCCAMPQRLRCWASFATPRRCFPVLWTWWFERIQMRCRLRATLKRCTLPSLLVVPPLTPSLQGASCVVLLPPLWAVRTRSGLRTAFLPASEAVRRPTLKWCGDQERTGSWTLIWNPSTTRSVSTNPRRCCTILGSRGFQAVITLGYGAREPKALPFVVVHVCVCFWFGLC